MSKKINTQTPTKIQALYEDRDWKDIAKENEIKTKALKNGKTIKK